MQSFLKFTRKAALILSLALPLTGAPAIGAFAQTATAPASTSLSEQTVRALQEALNGQGITVAISGVLNDETRAAIRKYQSQHHLSVTGDPDKATLDKLGVRVSAAPGEPAATAQAAPATPSPMPGGMMSGPMMQGMMQGMMQTMEGMMRMMEGRSDATRPQQPQGGMMMNCPMMRGASEGDAPAMMQMMQGMMRMMKTMQTQMPPGGN